MLDSIVEYSRTAASERTNVQAFEATKRVISEIIIKPCSFIGAHRAFADRNQHWIAIIGGIKSLIRQVGKMSILLERDTTVLSRWTMALAALTAGPLAR